ncbi:MAG TPA: transcriptional regulator [Roseomonas sp.]|nr:transcriptional regulator [Roseomonas sp.]
MIIFVDFEASSLGKHGFPVEVGWAAEDGTEEGYLIRPAPDWQEWSAEAEQVHGIPLERLMREGSPHEVVAQRMVEALTGHDLYASAPSWDGQWLSRLLRAAGLPRHALRLRDTEEAQRQAVQAVLEGASAEQVEDLLQAAQQAIEAAEVPTHRALDDARRELRLWREVRRRAAEAAASRV